MSGLDVERRVRTEIARVALPSAPESLRERVRAVAATERAVARVIVDRRGHASRGRLLLGLAAILLLGGAVAGISIQGRGPDFPAAVDGLTVMTVSEALAAHEAGELPGGRAAVKGWWSDGSVGHTCAAPPLGETPGDLELYCHDGESGITELNEPILVYNLQTGEMLYGAKGPHLTPYGNDPYPDDRAVTAMYTLPVINGQRYPPVPIVVVGHFDDPRAAACRPAFRQLCLDRLVIERVAMFDPSSVPTPGVTPTPTPFVPPPSGYFDASRCAGVVPYSFVGWTTTDTLHMQFERSGTVFAMVTESPVVLTESDDGTGYFDPPDGGPRYQLWGRKVCISQDASTMEYGWVIGTTYKHLEDGTEFPFSP